MKPMFDQQRLVRAYSKARSDLLSERNDQGHWVGELSASALSTATAISALSLAEPNHADQPLIDRGARWLVQQQNEDGGWGDTDQSFSNIATTLLAMAALRLGGFAEQYHDQLASAQRYVDRLGGLAALRKRYGGDKTFAVPILMNCALAGLVPWNEVDSLPFELACLPQSFYRWAGLPVVSYAIPALVAIGQARFLHQPPRTFFAGTVRRWAVEASTRVLLRMQPDSGGYLEAIPLSSFVAMGLASTERAYHPVVRRVIAFLHQTVRDDGSWPIDVNLATWTTTLSINALSYYDEQLPTDCLDWLLSCQHKVRHPFTGAEPGGWGWTDLSGAVPDADDTPGALLALGRMQREPQVDSAGQVRIVGAAGLGVQWLLRLQNRDGGWPTFCRGWGRLPFDRSGADLTAHAIRALLAWRDLDAARIDRACRRGMDYLDSVQNRDGSWTPLWFGNQYHPEEENLVYGTAKVLMAYGDVGHLGSNSVASALQWLSRNQNPDGGWGGNGVDLGGEFPEKSQSSVEETALAVEALVRGGGHESRQSEAKMGLNWLIQRVESGQYLNASPIGFYFAKLWYHERLYPLVFTVAALGAVLACSAGSTRSQLATGQTTRRVEGT